jgi:Fe-S cluster assembly protein SufB
MPTDTATIAQLTQREYEWGFYTDIEEEKVPKGLNEDIIRTISRLKGEPDWLLEWRLKAYRHWLTMEEPRWWPHIQYSRIDYQDIHYYAAPEAT